uniref:Uncharacterized protein n=1 Tax=Ananas comosus var. bracteatus TaxID=296719 RepID=A0A6V7PX86_ANACO|nr:unnamed protein product [Ananas comosus var. bracteatus]
MARVPRFVVQSLAPKPEKNGIWLTLGLSSGGLVPVQVVLVPVQPSELVPYRAAEPSNPSLGFGIRGPCTDLDYACLPFVLIRTCCEGRSLQADTPELAYATYVRSCGIEKPTGSSGTDTFQE